MRAQRHHGLPRSGSSPAMEGGVSTAKALAAPNRPKHAIVHAGHVPVEAAQVGGSIGFSAPCWFLEVFLPAGSATNLLPCDLSCDESPEALVFPRLETFYHITALAIDHFPGLSQVVGSQNFAKLDWHPAIDWLAELPQRCRKFARCNKSAMRKCFRAQSASACVRDGLAGWGGRIRTCASE
jgi:hypothetical protein